MVIAGDGDETLDRRWEVESLGGGAWEWVRQRSCDYVSYKIESEWYSEVAVAVLWVCLCEAWVEMRYGWVRVYYNYIYIRGF